jgi:Flp pilus assembly protein TadG
MHFKLDLCGRLRAARRERGQRRRGAVMVWLAVALILLIGFLGLAMDVSYVVGTLQELQVTADAAALAGAGQLIDDPGNGDPINPYDLSRQAAIDIALLNPAAKVPITLERNVANAVGGDVVLGAWDGINHVFVPDGLAPDSVKVVARRTASKNGALPLFFGKVFGVESVELERTATATIASSDDTVILILDPTGGEALALKGNSRMRAFGKVQVNSSASDALYLNGPPDVPRLRAKRINVHGKAQAPTGSTVPVPQINQPVIPDYLMYLPDHPDPSKTLLQVHNKAIDKAGNYTQGHYTGIDFTDGVAQLQPGIYIIGPNGIKLTADAQLKGTGVMLFIEAGGGIQIAGQGDAGLDITAPSTGLYRGIAFYMSRKTGTPGFDGPKAYANIQGGGLYDMKGTMYVKNAQIEMDGNVYRRIGSLVVFRQLVRGTASYDVTGEGPGAPVPPAPALVE